MSLSVEKVHDIGKSAKLAFSDQEASIYAKEIGDTFDYLQILSEVDTDDVEPTYYGRVNDLTPLRDDEPVRDDKEVDALLDFALSTRDQLIEVPAIIDQGEGGA